MVARIKDTPTWPRTPLLAIAQADDVEERVRLLEAGADDVVSRLVDLAELQLRLDVLLMRLPEAAPVAGGPSAPEERPAPLRRPRLAPPELPGDGVHVPQGRRRAAPRPRR
ncbi:MAG: hypothetical protein U0869_13480 [Chloroflexota bacterium]